MIREDLKRVHGRRVALRLVEPEDAAYIYGLRTNPLYNMHLSAVTGSVDDQREWIIRYKAREADGTELYYLIERLDDGRPCGVVRLYEISGDQFTWGSWILDENKPAKAALESALLSFGIGFGALNLDRARVDVRAANEHALAFYRRLGMIEVKETPHDIVLSYTRRHYEADLDSLRQAIGICKEELQS